MSQQIIYILIILGLANMAIVFYFFKRMSDKSEIKPDDTAMRLLLDQVNNLSRAVDEKMGRTHDTVTASMKHQFSESQILVDKFLKELTHMTEKVTRVEETGKQMLTIGVELQSLQDILKNPKQRGILGEYYLETLLKNVLPPSSYEMQYAFQDGTIVDAMVRVKDKIIPIDSKFSLENYNRLVNEMDPAEKERLSKIFENDLKNRILETSKYIKPSENTMDFAFMFIPHEAIYYDLLVNKVGEENLIQRAASKYKVIIVSPTSFLAYLQTVLQGLKAMQIEETAKDIVKRVDELGKHLKSYEEYHTKLGNSLATTVSHFNASGKELKKVDKDVMRIAGTAPGLESLVLDKPDRDEE